MPRHSNGMYCIECALIGLVEGDAANTSCDRRLVALAGIIGELTSRQTALLTGCPHPNHIWNNTTVGRVIQGATSWLCQNTNPPLATTDEYEATKWSLFFEVQKLVPFLCN